jgi:hypothetical protein
MPPNFRSAMQKSGQAPPPKAAPRDRRHPRDDDEEEAAAAARAADGLRRAAMVQRLFPEKFDDADTPNEEDDVDAEEDEEDLFDEEEAGELDDGEDVSDDGDDDRAAPVVAAPLKKTPAMTAPAAAPSKKAISNEFQKSHVQERQRRRSVGRVLKWKREPTKVHRVDVPRADEKSKFWFGEPEPVVTRELETIVLPLREVVNFTIDTPAHIRGLAWTSVEASVRQAKYTRSSIADAATAEQQAAYLQGEYSQMLGDARALLSSSSAKTAGKKGAAPAAAVADADVQVGAPVRVTLEVQAEAPSESDDDEDVQQARIDALARKLGMKVAQRQRPAGKAAPKPPKEMPWISLFSLPEGQPSIYFGKGSSTRAGTGMLPAGTYSIAARGSAPENKALIATPAGKAKLTETLRMGALVVFAEMVAETMEMK